MATPTPPGTLRRFVLPTWVATALFISGGSLAAQQYVVDDAVIVAPRSCQAEMWHGERASWILPACQILPNLEVTVGAGFVNGDGSDRESEYTLEGKTILREMGPEAWGVGVVVGIGPNPSADVDERVFGDIYLFVPASRVVLDGGLVVHGNLGWRWDRETVPEPGQRRRGPAHHLTWGLRADVPIHAHLSLLGETYGEDLERPAVQVGFRTHFPNAGMEVDASWGRSSTGSGDGPGFTLGLSLTSGPLF